ncbi:hypothetical protein B566_EDAN016008 [Ephemera danica]|nr:hypothetical protein B566_EDAN016008 [Ephemera danica]
MGNKKSKKLGKGNRRSKVSKARIKAQQERKKKETESREILGAVPGSSGEISTPDAVVCAPEKSTTRDVDLVVNIDNVSGQAIHCVPIYSTPPRNNGSNNICSTANKTLPIFSPGTTQIYNTIADGFPNKYDFSSQLPYAIERSTETETTDEDEVIRLVDVMYFSKEILKIERRHRNQCTDGKMEPVRILKRTGLQSALYLACSICKRDATIECQSEASPDFNTNAVWGSLNAGIGHSQLEDVFAYLEVPIMCADKYKDIVTDLNEAVIIGTETQKLLHYGVLCRNCATCSTAERLNREPRPHECSKNYDGPSTAMEWNIIVNGFNCSKEVHGLRYKFFIADGDANVLHQVKLQCSYGRSVRKIECANHKVRCITSNLHKIAANTSLNVEARKILKSRIPSLSKGARSAIRYCHQNNDTVDDLRFDFENLPNHVFGDHSKCLPYIRDHCKIDEENLIPFLQEKRSYYKNMQRQTCRLHEKQPVLNTCRRRCTQLPTWTFLVAESIQSTPRLDGVSKPDLDDSEMEIKVAETIESLQTWQEKLQDYMIATGKMEKEIAIARGDIDPDGVPFVTVIVDGGWCRRSFGHNYNAHGGVAVIIGAETQKLLHYGVLCRNCATCSTAERLNREPRPHECSKNYDGPSTAMEWNIIVNGFNCSEEVHGLRYKFFIADGDANVLHQVKLQCPYGRSVRKIECANHKVRCITSNLHKIAANTSLNVEARKILKSRIPRLSKGARSAIRYCHQNNDTVDDLRFDFENLPNHVFGDHSKCRPYIRDHCKIDEENLIPFLQEKRVFHDIKSVLKSLINNAHSLIKNKTSNLAENVFSLTTKTCNGKRVDYTRSNQYETRVVVAALNFQRGHFWSLSPYKALHGVSPGPVLKNAMRRKDKKRKANAAKNLNKKFKAKGPSKQADKHYGAVAEIIDTVDGVSKPDLDDSEIEIKVAETIESLQVTEEMRDRIERLTIGQSDNPHWHDARENRITASEFSSVVDRRKATSSDLVRRLLYSTCKETESMKYGKRNEHVAIQRFTQSTGLNVEECGIFIDLTYGFLGASPDGLIGDKGLVEVKCIPSVRDIGLRAAAEDTKHKRYGNFCLCINEEDKPMHIEKIERKKETWEQEMLPNLISFFHKCMVLEIVDPRTCRGLPIREPATPYQQNVKKVTAVKKRNNILLRNNSYKYRWLMHLSMNCARVSELACMKHLKARERERVKVVNNYSKLATVY